MYNADRNRKEIILVLKIFIDLIVMFNCIQSSKVIDVKQIKN